MKPETVLEIYQLFLQSDDCKANSRLADNLKTTLRRYILPQYGFTAAMLSDDLDGCLKRVTQILHHSQEGVAKRLKI
ncbi:hypothetical protein C7B65_25275 [Phormidesmis priestleyi ULC007]|uniref:Uncharacterized protein n=1 Tax=Phormidesmis priestleyi ULC007 TaxID=1920490 RepID=A0A2T1D3M7_9CYAN|nr:hypothetical protein [Phormidesmis priestleyi]PSB15113.1 hypothetical protein C7B65_25275 [Phormidesmis priestleyi ULC007]PZO45999.1 MAG: hypothetical protein DCF14_24125 [Phormidesmis priestleyi]